MKHYTAFLVPQFNLLIRDPVTKVAMLPEGEVKPLFGREGRYWKRRLKEGSVRIKDIKPKKGASLYGPFDGQSFTAANSLVITYGYELHSRDKAEVRQWALKANTAVAANNWWTVGTIHRGVGEVKTALTIKCKSSNQPDTAIKYILVKLIDPKTHQVIKQFQHLVNYTFKCEKPGEIK